MAKLKERKYRCMCGEEVKEYVWDNELESHNFPCPKCHNNLKISDIVKEEKIQVQGIRTPTKNR